MHSNPVCSARYRSALHLAFEAHEGQVRKGTGVPYVTHPIAVAEYVNYYGGSGNQICAALLHDVVEDSNYDREDIFTLFGANVGNLVDAMTYPWGKAYKLAEKPQVVYNQLARVTGAGQIKGCDLLDNVSNIIWDIEKDGIETLEGLFGRDRWPRKLDYYNTLYLKISPLCTRELSLDLRERFVEMRKLIKREIPGGPAGLKREYPGLFN